MTEKNAIDILKSLVGFDTTSSKSNLDLIEFIESYLNNHKIKSTLVYDSSGKKPIFTQQLVQVMKEA